MGRRARVAIVEHVRWSSVDYRPLSGNADLFNGKRLRFC